MFYATAKLKYASEEINRKNLLETPSSIKFADLAFDIVNNSPKQNLPLLYKLLFQFNKNPSMPLFQEIKQLLFSHSEDFDLEEQLITLGYLLNYTASKIKHGETRYLKEAFDLNQYGISTGMLIQDGFIPPSQFHNIVNLACWLKKFNWAQTFVETHSEHLREPFRKDAKLLAQTIITFEKQDFLNVVETLKEVEFSDGHFALRAKSLILRSYIEQAKDADQVLLFCESFERFIRRHSVIKGETETAALNFIKFIKMLTRKKTSEPKLKSEIAEAHPVFFKPWLIQKAAAYKQKFAAHTLRR
ncbi:MAG TPA: hypothetical protein ENJ95_17315 [Bacteroidetes bacterium]|nr:hypothetical protein [Bacteroidota bacterium]